MEICEKHDDQVIGYTDLRKKEYLISSSMAKVKRDATIKICLSISISQDLKNVLDNIYSDKRYLYTL